ncbi:hypothetical protein B1L04_16670 [Microcystis aeruginosa KW]|uniref:Uncharacterized protein n=1 Tax=Microcystis aeruginosa KW TaxID=1960155 RepID=A0A1V4BT95_MICAE|nr:hypothetical protein B1L04_16670 [Microcystis aeruginosa KW]
MIHTQSQQRRASFNLTTPKPTASINVHGAFPKIDRWSSRSHIRERTLRLRRSVCMGVVMLFQIRF